MGLGQHVCCVLRLSLKKKYPKVASEKLLPDISEEVDAKPSHDHIGIEIGSCTLTKRVAAASGTAVGLVEVPTAPFLVEIGNPGGGAGVTRGSPRQKGFDFNCFLFVKLWGNEKTGGR